MAWLCEVLLCGDSLAVCVTYRCLVGARGGLDTQLRLFNTPLAPLAAGS